MKPPAVFHTRSFQTENWTSNVIYAILATVCNKQEITSYVGDDTAKRATSHRLCEEKIMFLNDWESQEKMMEDFEISDNDMEGVTILLASYTNADYNGDAFVLFTRNGKLYEVNGSRCSCYGLEGQWEPEETTVEALLHRIQEGELGTDDAWDEKRNVFAIELLQVLKDYICGIRVW